MTKPETETSTHALISPVDISAISIFSRQKTYKMPITTPNMEEDWRSQRNTQQVIYQANYESWLKAGAPEGLKPHEPVDPAQPVIRDLNGNSAYIEILSAQDAAVQSWYAANPGIMEDQTPEGVKVARLKIAAELLPIMVKSWYWVNPETQEAIDLPCTPEIVTAVFTADEYDHLFVKVMNTMASNRHFFKA